LGLFVFYRLLAETLTMKQTGRHHQRAMGASQYFVIAIGGALQQIRR